MTRFKLAVAVLILSGLALAQIARASTSFAAPATTFKSSVDGVNGDNALFGWIFDPVNPSRPIQISIYRDGPRERGVLVATITADALRADVDAVFHISGGHGFYWRMPPADQNQLHFWYAYATGADGHAAPLDNSPYVFPAITVSVTGAPQTVFAYAADKCDSIDIPDNAARAYRDAAGHVNLIASHYETRRAIGATLDAVVHQCAVIHRSHNDPEFSHLRYREWMHSFYTLDGVTIYSIVHNEWYANLVDAACGKDMIDGWVSGSTLAISHDGGATFSDPKDYLVRYPLTPWSASFPCSHSHWTRYGDFGGTNIIARDGYFYKFFAYNSEPSVNPHQFGECLMRTRDLSNASSWEIWDGSGYLRSKTAPCALIPNIINIQSVTNNTYLKLYVSIGQTPLGFFLSFSRDLIDWSRPLRLKIDGLDPLKAPYPSLLDPRDTSRNFENTGQTPYLYYTQLHGGLDNDLMRAQLRFSGAPAKAQ